MLFKASYSNTEILNFFTQNLHSYICPFKYVLDYYNHVPLVIHSSLIPTSKNPPTLLITEIHVALRVEVRIISSPDNDCTYNTL